MLDLFTPCFSQIVTEHSLTVSLCPWCYGKIPPTVDIIDLHWTEVGKHTSLASCGETSCYKATGHWIRTCFWVRVPEWNMEPDTDNSSSTENTCTHWAATVQTDSWMKQWTVIFLLWVKTTYQSSQCGPWSFINPLPLSPPRGRWLPALAVIHWAAFVILGGCRTCALVLRP